MNAMELSLKPIAHIENDFSEKFGIPRQSGLVKEVLGKIVFEPEFARKEALRGLEQYRYLWLIFGFSKNVEKHWSATVKPPRLGGKTRMGVFATRSPYRPNPLGLSSVKIEKIMENDMGQPEILVSGADLLNQTPIYDIKPYLVYADSHPDAGNGFADNLDIFEVTLVFPDEQKRKLPEEKIAPITAILKQDPRPGYDYETNRDYKIMYGGYDIHFCAKGKTLTVTDVIWVG